MPLNLLVSTKIVGQRGSSRTLLRDWRIVCLEEDGADITFLDLFNGIVARRFDEHDTIVLPPEFVDQPVLSFNWLLVIGGVVRGVASNIKIIRVPYVLYNILYM